MLVLQQQLVHFHVIIVVFVCKAVVVSFWFHEKKIFTFFINFGFIERGITGFGRSETENRGHGGPGNFFGGNNVIPCIFGSGRNENSIEESKLVHTY